MSATVLEWWFPGPPAALQWVVEDEDELSQHTPEQAALAAVVAQGAGGAASTISRLAGEAIGGHRAVKVLADNKAWLASPADADVEAVVGLTDNAASTGDALTIRFAGELTHLGWSWTAGPVWLGAGGTLTQVVPTSGAIIRIGEAVGPTAININPRLVARF